MNNQAMTPSSMRVMYREQVWCSHSNLYLAGGDEMWVAQAILTAIQPLPWFHRVHPYPVQVDFLQVGKVTLAGHWPNRATRDWGVRIDLQQDLIDAVDESHLGLDFFSLWSKLLTGDLKCQECLRRSMYPALKAVSGRRCPFCGCNPLTASYDSVGRINLDRAERQAQEWAFPQIEKLRSER